MKQCQHCHHYVVLGEGKNGKGESVTVGNCYRYPPKITVGGGSSYPVVGEIERECGEFTPPKRKGPRK